MIPKITKHQASILENHKIFKYEFEDINDALDKLMVFQRYQKVFLDKHPSFRMNIKVKPTESKTILTVEIWTFPQLSKN